MTSARSFQGLLHRRAALFHQTADEIGKIVGQQVGDFIEPDAGATIRNPSGEPGLGNPEDDDAHHVRPTLVLPLRGCPVFIARSLPEAPSCFRWSIRSSRLPPIQAARDPGLVSRRSRAPRRRNRSWCRSAAEPPSTRRWCPSHARDARSGAPPQAIHQIEPAEMELRIDACGDLHGRAARGPHHLIRIV